MTGEPTHIASKERMVPELIFLTERTSQLSITNLKVQWQLRFGFQQCSANFSLLYRALQMKNSRRSASAVTMKHTDDSQARK